LKIKYEKLNAKQISTVGDPEFNTLPSIEVIESNTFHKSNIKVINLPEGVQEIENFAFSYCLDLIGVYLPNSLTLIREWAFDYTGAISFATAQEETVLDYQEYIIPEKRISFAVEKIYLEGYYLYGYYSDASIILMKLVSFSFYEYSNIELPKSINFLPVTALAAYLFEDYIIEDLYIFNEVNSISEFCFYGAEIDRIILYYELPENYSDDWNYNGAVYIDFSIQSDSFGSIVIEVVED
jgi:hypothetical protein